MKKKTTRKPPTAVLILAVAVITAVSFAVAWLTIGDEILDRTYKLSNFDAYAEVYFMDGVTKVTPAKDTLEAVVVDVNNESAPNYIGKLKVDAFYKGKGKAYLRLKVVQQWLNSGGEVIQSNAVLPYTVEALYAKGVDTGNQPKWFDNRADDYCLYYAQPVQGNNSDYLKLPVFTGLDTAEFNATAPLEGGTATLKLAFELQMVQVNRYPQFWGLSELPWLEE